jgi:hypothetical protein
LTQSIMSSLVIQTFSWHRKTRPAGSFSLGIVFRCKITYRGSLRPSARTPNITVILAFSLPVHLIKTVFCALFIDGYVRQHVKIYRRLIGISDMAQNIRVLLSQFYNMPLELEQLSRELPGSLCSRVVRRRKVSPGHLIIRTHQPVLALNLPVFAGVGISRGSSSALVRIISHVIGKPSLRFSRTYWIARCSR